MIYFWMIHVLYVLYVLCRVSLKLSSFNLTFSRPICVLVGNDRVKGLKQFYSAPNYNKLLKVLYLKFI